MYKFTKKLFLNKNLLIPNNCTNRSVYSTIINRCYYSSYLFAKEWLFEKYGFEPLSKDDFRDNSFITEHIQVRLKFKNLNQFSISNNLFKLFNLRKKADYNPFSDISDNELTNAMNLMEIVFNSLKF